LQLLLAVLVVACLLPFCGKPYHIDDPLFVWCAEQVLAHPADPYGSTVNWYGIDQAMDDVMWNPPLSCYYMAGWMLLGSTREWVLHLGFMLAAVAAVIATFRLSGRCCRTPWLSALLLLLSPGFTVSATTVMCDVPALALMLWFLVMWMDGRLWVSALLLGACIMTKYNAGLVILPAAAFALASHKPVRGWIAFLLAPLALPPLWYVCMGYAFPANPPPTAGPAVSLTIGLIFLGGCAGAACFALIAGTRRWGILGAALTLPAILFFHTFWKSSGGQAAQMAIWFIGGLAIVAVGVRSAFVDRRPELVAMFILLLSVWGQGLRTEICFATDACEV